MQYRSHGYCVRLLPAQRTALLYAHNDEDEVRAALQPASIITARLTKLFLQLPRGGPRTPAATEVETDSPTGERTRVLCSTTNTGGGGGGEAR